MQEAVLIFPHQLFKNHPAIGLNRTIFLVEEWLFFRQYSFHKHKLILHRSTMKCYEHFLQANGFKTNYIETHENNNDVRNFITELKNQGYTAIHLAEPNDDWLMKRIRHAAHQHQMECHVYESPYFLNTATDGKAFFSNKKRFHQTDFYIDQRKKREILLTADRKPLGDAWTFDADNRQRYPRNQKPPITSLTTGDSYIEEACAYVEKHFPNNPGRAEGPFLFVTNYEAADEWLQAFLQNRFKDFGVYEDAIVAKENILHHSVLSPLLNIGLLLPDEVLNKTLDFANRQQIPINSTEGFVRQIIGWREFVRIIYDAKGSKQRTTNFWQFNKKIPSSFYDGTTGIAPIDLTIQKILKTGYCHHIERLMVLGNFMLLCEFDPDEVYQWFMEMFIDAYDWVMVPNVYGMTQFADGGLMTTKPYISGSNYLMKMSDYEKGPWQDIWDGLFWRFMHTHRNFFLQNPRLGMLIKTFDKMSEEKRNKHLNTAENYLNAL